MQTNDLWPIYREYYKSAADRKRSNLLHICMQMICGRIVENATNRLQMDMICFRLRLLPGLRPSLGVARKRRPAMVPIMVIYILIVTREA